MPSSSSIRWGCELSACCWPTTPSALLADDAFGRDTLVGVERTMKALQVEPVAVARIDNRKPDVTESVRAVLAKRPEVVLLVVSSEPVRSFVCGA